MTYEDPRFRPDGRAFYFTANADEKQIYSVNRLAMAAWPWPAAGAPAILSPGFDRSVESWAFTPDGQRIYLTAEDAGLEKVYVGARLGR